MHKQHRCTQWRSDAYHPRTADEIRWNFDPKNCTEKKKNEESSPFEWTPGLGADVGLSATVSAYPAGPESERKNGDPKYMNRVKSTDPCRATGLSTRKTVVVPKGDSFRAEMVDTVNYEHVIRDILPYLRNGMYVRYIRSFRQPRIYVPASDHD